MVSSAGILSFDKSGLSGRRSNLTLLNAMRNSALVMNLNSQINFTLQHWWIHSSCNCRQCWRISNLHSVWRCIKQIYHSFSQNFFSRDMKTAGLVQTSFLNFTKWPDFANSTIVVNSKGYYGHNKCILSAQGPQGAGQGPTRTPSVLPSCLIFCVKEIANFLWAPGQDAIVFRSRKNSKIIHTIT